MTKVHKIEVPMMEIINWNNLESIIDLIIKASFEMKKHIQQRKMVSYNGGQ